MNDDDLQQRMSRTLTAHRDATEARRAAGLRPALSRQSPDRPPGRARWAPLGSRRAVGTGVAVSVAIVVAGIAVLGRGSHMDEQQRIDAAAGTVAQDRPSESTTTTVSVGGPPTTSVESPGPDRPAALWFRNHYEGLADDRGRFYRHRIEVDYAGPMVRTPQGDIYFVQDQQLLVLAPGQVDPAPVEVDGPVGYLLELDSSGQVAWLDSGGAFRRLDGGPATPGPAAERTAINGWTARLSASQAIRDPSNGMVEEVTEPARLEILDPTGTVARTFTVGGSSATEVGLEDFDGRRVIVSRAPEEPAAGPTQMLLIDLACDPVCVRTSIGLGDTVLNGPDVAGDPPLAPVPGGPASSADYPLGLCPTEGTPVPDPPAELPSLGRRAYRRLALGLATCDPFTFQAATADARVEWSLLLAALSSPPIETSTGGQAAWNFTDPASERWLSIDATGQWTIYQPTG